MNSTATDTLGELHYPRNTDGYDEAYAGQPQIQSHWEYLFDGLKELGVSGITERHRKAERILRDDGATYNSGLLRFSKTWQLDPVPVLLESEEWGRIESGLTERAELLNLLLKDLYGKRELIRHGIIPPELLFNHRGFLRPCDGLMLPGEHQLLLHAADMVRNAEGEMVVIADRTQSPSGSGYALENRMVMSRVLPSLFRDSHVHRLSLFFQTLRLKLNHLASHITSELPRIVILTPGSSSETYFEHAYLANYLGYPLVQGSDLRVSNGRLWMKSMSGLEPVDVVVRRVDDIYCDPVELKSNSRLGVPGLLEVVRSGRVLVVNPLGSGILENPALLRYLPQIGQHFLGREPRLASVKTYWCANPKDMAYIADNIVKLVIKPTYRKQGVQSIFGSQLDKTQQQQLLQKLKNKPLNYVAQEYLQHATAPTWDKKVFVPRPAMLRSFSVASHSSYSVLPGGLSRVGSDKNSLILNSQAGAISKDTWVLASEPEKQVSLQQSQSLSAMAAIKPRAVFPCRVVENLYWMGRYAERAESALRLLRTVFVQINSTYHMSEQTQQVLLQAVTKLTNTFPGFTTPESALQSQPESELLAVILDSERTGSVSSNLNALLECADQVREMLSADTQRVINDLRDELSHLEEALQPGLNAAPEEALDPLVTTLLALSGLWQESMIRGLGWRFMDMGRRVEKTLQSVRLLRATLVKVLPEEEQETVLEAILMSAETLITFRRRQHLGDDLPHGLELLLHDNSNPRSVFYQIELLQGHLQALPSSAHGVELADEDRSILEASTAIQLSNPATLLVEDELGTTRPELDQLLSRLQHLLQETSTQISSKYFDEVKVHHQLVQTNWDEEL